MDVNVIVLLVASMGDQPEALLRGMTAGTEGTGTYILSFRVCAKICLV